MPKTHWLGDLAGGLSEGFVQGQKLKMEADRLKEEIRIQDSLNQYRARQLEQEQAKMDQQGQQFNVEAGLKGQELGLKQRGLEQEERHQKVSEKIRMQELAISRDAKDAHSMLYGAQADLLKEQTKQLREGGGTAGERRQREKLLFDVQTTMNKEAQDMYKSISDINFSGNDDDRAATIQTFVDSYKSQLLNQGLTPTEIESLVAPHERRMDTIKLKTMTEPPRYKAAGAKWYQPGREVAEDPIGVLLAAQDRQETNYDTVRLQLQKFGGMAPAAAKELTEQIKTKGLLNVLAEMTGEPDLKEKAKKIIAKEAIKSKE